MKRAKADSIFVQLVKAVLKDAGFKRRRNNCFVVRELQVVLSLRNRWGGAIHDLCLEISADPMGTLVQDDVRHLFQEFYDFRAEFSDEELLANSPYTESRLRDVLKTVVAPQCLLWTNKVYFLQQLDAGRFAGSGVYIHAVAALRAAD